MDFINLLPKSLKTEVGSFFSPNELTLFSHVSQQWNRGLGAHSQLWEIHLKRSFNVDYNLLKAKYGDNLLSAKNIYARLDHYFFRNRSEVFYDYLKKIIDKGQFYPPLFLARLPATGYPVCILGLWLNDAAKLGNKKLIGYLLETLPIGQRPQPDQLTLNSAALSGDLELVSYLVNNFALLYHFQPDIQTLRNAALSGNCELMRFLIEEIPDTFRELPNQSTLHAAVQSNSLSVVRYLTSELNEAIRLCPDQESLLMAARAGFESLVKFFIQDLPAAWRIEIDNRIIWNAVESGSLSLMRYLLEEVDPGRSNKFIVDLGALYGAARSGNKDLVVYLQKKCSIAPDGTTLGCAIESGNQGLVEYLINVLGTEALFSEPGILSAAMCSGSLPLVQCLVEIYIKENELPNLVFQEYKKVFQTRNLALITYLVEEAPETFRLPVNMAAVDEAMSGGHGPIMCYLAKKVQENGEIAKASAQQREAIVYWMNLNSASSVDEYAEPISNRLNIAFDSGDYYLLEYLFSKRPIQHQLGAVELYRAVGSGNFNLVHYLTQRITISPKMQPNVIALAFAARSGNFYLSTYVAEILMQNKIDFDETVLSSAVQSGSLKLLNYFMFKVPSDFRVKPTQKTLESALSANNLGIVRFLVETIDGSLRLSLTDSSLEMASRSGNQALIDYVSDKTEGQPQEYCGRPSL